MHCSSDIEEKPVPAADTSASASTSDESSKGLETPTANITEQDGTSAAASPDEPHCSTSGTISGEQRTKPGAELTNSELIQPPQTSSPVQHVSQSSRITNAQISSTTFLLTEDVAGTRNSANNSSSIDDNPANETECGTNALYWPASAEAKYKIASREAEYWFEQTLLYVNPALECPGFD